MDILVTGASGTLGRPVAQVLEDRGHHVDRGSRTAHDGYVEADVARALPDGPYDAVVHCATDIAKAKDVETEGLRRLREAYPEARIVYPSIVGCDRIRFSYYRVKAASERLLADLGGDHAIVRITQFHEFADRLARLPVPMVLAAMRAQTISAQDAAEAVADAVEGDAQGRLEDVGGPEVHRMVDLVRQRLRADGRRRPVLRLPLGYRGFKAGHNLCPEQRQGRITWDEHLAMAP